MLAEQNKTYAQVLHGRCHWIFTSKELPEWNENDIETVDITGQNIQIGYIFTDGIFSEPITEQPTNEELANLIRTKRDSFLSKSDWTQLSDVPLITLEKWKPYRQELRDITEQLNFPTTIIWPTTPI